MSLIFINALISGADDVDFRIHLRNELFSNELLHMLKVRVPCNGRTILY